MIPQTTQRETFTVLWTRPRAYDAIKRIIDCIASCTGLILLAPIAFLITVAILLDDGAPVFFRQRRVGRNGRHFTMLKFRTMVLEAPDVSTEKMKRLRKSFHTRVGTLLRKTSLDELPQLWNILRGDMSVVGPRPALHNQDRLIALREAARVHAVRPGLTGLAQVKGRDDLDDETKVAYDREYAIRRNLRLDCTIVLETLTAIASARGNY